jgi:signal transduction histidine kinase
LHILYPRSFLRQARWQAAYPPLVVGGVLLGVVVLLAVSLAERLTRPILALGHQLRQLVAGQFQPLAVPSRNDELSDLVRSVNFLGDQLDEMRRAIHRSERLTLLGQLSGGLAHQLRNSVAGARIAVQLHKRHCARIDQDSLAVALRQLTITESHLSRFLSAGQPNPPRLAECDLRQVVTDVAGLVAPAFSHRNVRLVLDDCQQRLAIRADADQLGQLLLNLLINAMEAAAGGGGWVRVDLAREGPCVAIRISDSGPGPAAAVVDRLFEPFVTGKPEGIGLGLAVARQIAEAHGGAIRFVGNTPCCFEVILPADWRAGASPAALSLPSAPATRHPVLKI